MRQCQCCARTHDGTNDYCRECRKAPVPTALPDVYLADLDFAPPHVVTVPSGGALRHSLSPKGSVPRPHIADVLREVQVQETLRDVRKVREES